MKPKRRRAPAPVSAVVFGSDQGLVGQFNDVVADYAIQELAKLPGQHQVWAVGARVHEHLADAGVQLMDLFSVPTSVQAITPLVGVILADRSWPMLRKPSWPSVGWS